MEMNRYKASAIHFAISALVATLVFAAMSTFWYPGVFFDAAGGKDLFLLIAGVDVTLGPLITLIVFVPGKRGLRFDLTFVVAKKVCSWA
jgi:cytochrome c oxidase assembly factor CtaG